MHARTLVGLITLILATTLTAAEPAPPPNLIVMLIDDMGIMDTSLPFLTDADGKPQRYPLNDFYRTPNMERLAARGVRFNQFNAMSVCSPTRVSLLTGQNAARHRTTNWINPDQDNTGPQGPTDWNWNGLQPGDVTLPALLRERGYRTIHIGKGHFGPRHTPGADPATLGFDVNIAGGSIGAPGSYYGKQNFDRPAQARGKAKAATQTQRKAAPARGSPAVPGLEKYHGQDVFLTEALTREAKSQLSDAVAARKPFFLYFAHYAVHSPFDSDPRFADHYQDSGKSPQAQAFATLIEGMDQSLGDLLDHLDALGIADNTLVLFLGDNGSDAPLGPQHDVACAAPLRGKKGSHYEGGMRVPFLAAWAKPTPDAPAQKRLPITPGAIQSQLASVPDIFPTLLRLTGAQAPASHAIDGRPLDALLTGQPDATRPAEFLMHYPHGPHRSNYFTTWRQGDWKVIYHYLPNVPTHGDLLQSSGATYQLFNLKDDPFEQRDLATTHPAELKRLMEGLIAALEDHHATYPLDPATRAALKPRLP